MTIFNAFVLGVIQGLTEFIPVSSTAHLLIFGRLLGISADERMIAFSVVVQLGTVAAMLVFFWKDIWQIVCAFLSGLLKHKPFDDFHARLGWYIIIATLPALTVGFLLKDVVETMFAEPFAQAGIRLVVTAILLTLVEVLDKRQRTLDSATWADALFVGLFQTLAIFPGASRSGSTIAGGMLRGFDRASAARFAFLMSAPILLAAGAYQSLEVIRMTGTHELFGYLIIGCLTAGVVGWFSIKWLIAYLSKRSLYIFSAYCAALGLLLLIK
ncbi:MAG: undecaprenyl-diphosphatase UppP [Anaerolineales bacterium]|nr:undecaprenyl-diphosphatase UppP [Anaerolineales bacterium]